MTRLLTLLAFAVAFYLALIVGASNAHGGVTQLEAKLPTRITVICEAPLAGYSGGYANIPQREIHLSELVCRTLLNYRPAIWAYSNAPMPWSSAVHVLYHEWWHVQFQTWDEQATDCGAYLITRRMLRRFWNVKPRLVELLYRESWAPVNHYEGLGCKP